MVDLMIANLLAQDRHRSGEAYPLYIKVLRANPYIPSLYKDLGDHFMRGYEPIRAWTCYDLGRALAGRWEDDLLKHVDDYEANLLQHFPAFF
jgi:hypothetical protein